MSVERLLLARLVVAISLYMIQPDPQTLCVKFLSTRTLAQFQESEMFTV